jgi:hypothetical protein
MQVSYVIIIRVIAKSLLSHCFDQAFPCTGLTPQSFYSIYLYTVFHSDYQLVEG